jgi:LPS sulfotransferase NodH
MIRKFVLVTRGRTGSAAVLNELGKCRNIVTTHELFSRYNFPEETLKSRYILLLPFDLWKRQSWWERVTQASYSEARLARRYFVLAESLARQQAARAFGWKVLSHHFDQSPFLGGLLKHHGYCVVYLRRNSVRQVLSGMVANQRGVYHSLEKVTDARRYLIEIEKFQWLVKWERECVKGDCAKLRADGFEIVEVSYEDYCGNREVFFSSIFKLLDLPLELPPPSDFFKTIDDLKLVIANYDEVADAAVALGEAI